MPVRKAQRLCPDLIVLPPNPRLYARASRALHEILRVFAPTIEPRGYGHAFLDLTGTGRIFGPPQDVAARIRREASERLRLPLSVGIATNKLVSQAAIRVDRVVGRSGGRAVNESQLYVPSGEEGCFLAPQPLEIMPELDPGMRARLEDYQLDFIGEVAVISETALCAVFGSRGRTLRARAQGIDPRPVLSPERQSEFHVVHTLATDTNDLSILHPMLRMMGERLGRRLRERGLTAGRLRLEATYADYTTIARGIPLRSAALDVELWDAARRALALASTKRLAIRAVALTLDRLTETEAQLELWGGSGAGTRLRVDGKRGSKTDTLWESEVDGRKDSSSTAALQRAVDCIHSRYGVNALRRGGPLSHRSRPTHEDPTAVPPYRRTADLHQTTTILPKVAFPSRTLCASAS
jgi:DNA polymerase-4